MWRRFLEAAWDLVFPPRQVCPLCGGHSPGALVCPACGEILSGYTGEIICKVCGSFSGLKNPVDGSGTGYCPHCAPGRRTFDLARSVGPYEGPLRDAVHRLKYRGLKSLARPMGKLMADAALREPALGRTQALVPVPLSPGRERQRGFNQALLLAREMEAPLGVRVLESVIVKKHETPPQTSLDRQERLTNLVTAFAINDPSPIEGRIITVIDDVFTTGSTVSIISQVLRQAGATSVMALTFAGTRYSGNRRQISKKLSSSSDISLLKI